MHAVNLILAAASIAIAVTAPAQALAQQPRCTINIDAMTFGTYDPFSGADASVARHHPASMTPLRRSPSCARGKFQSLRLHHRRAVNRWERTSVGDLLERVTWSDPDRVAVSGRPGAYADEAFRTLTYRQADELAKCMNAAESR